MDNKFDTLFFLNHGKYKIHMKEIAPVLSNCARVLHPIDIAMVGRTDSPHLA